MNTITLWLQTAGLILLAAIGVIASLVLMACVWIGYILIFIGLPVFIVVWAIKELL